MDNQVEATIAHLRARVRAGSDAELARRLDIDQSTISSWRARGRVPKRFVNMLDDQQVKERPGAPEVFGEIEKRAVAIALSRFAMLRRDVFTAGNIDGAMTALLDIRPYWLIMHRAVSDIRGRMIGLDVSPPTAQALVLQDDLRNVDATVERVQQQLAEDMRDNPGLTEWGDGPDGK